MKKAFFLFVALIVFTSFSGLALAKIEVPGRTKSWVNDYAGIIGEDAKAHIEKLASSVKQKTPEPAEVIIATFRSLDGWQFDDFSREYAEKWRAAKIGRRDNGVIILVAVQERRVGIGVGRNLNNILTPAVTDDIIKNTLTPDFSQAKYSDGLRKATEAIVNILNEAAIPTDNVAVYIKWAALLAVVIAVLVFLSRRRH